MSLPAADYIVIVSNEEDYHAGFHQFSDKINRKLKAGYRLHGPPFSLNQKLVCQAMIRLEGASSVGETTLYSKMADLSHLG